MIEKLVLTIGGLIIVGLMVFGLMKHEMYQRFYERLDEIGHETLKTKTPKTYTVQGKKVTTTYGIDGDAIVVAVFVEGKRTRMYSDYNKSKMFGKALGSKWKEFKAGLKEGSTKESEFGTDFEE